MNTIATRIGLLLAVFAVSFGTLGSPAQAVDYNKPGKPGAIKCSPSPGFTSSCEKRREWYGKAYYYVPGNNAHNLRVKTARVLGTSLAFTPGAKDNVEAVIQNVVTYRQWKCFDRQINVSAWKSAHKDNMADLLGKIYGDTSAKKSFEKQLAKPSYFSAYLYYAKSLGKISKTTVDKVGGTIIAREFVTNVYKCAS